MNEYDERPDGRPVRARFTCDVFQILMFYEVFRESSRLPFKDAKVML